MNCARYECTMVYVHVCGRIMGILPVWGELEIEHSSMADVACLGVVLAGIPGGAGDHGGVEGAPDARFPAQARPQPRLAPPQLILGEATAIQPPRLHLRHFLWSGLQLLGFSSVRAILTARVGRIGRPQRHERH